MCFKYVNDNEKIFSWLCNPPFLLHPLSLSRAVAVVLSPPTSAIHYFVYTKNQHEKLFALFVYLLWFVASVVCLFGRSHGPHRPLAYSNMLAWTSLLPNSRCSIVVIQLLTVIMLLLHICTRFYVLQNFNHPFIYSPLFFVCWCRFRQCLHSWLLFFFFRSHIAVHMHTVLKLNK